MKRIFTCVLPILWLSLAPAILAEETEGEAALRSQVEYLTATGYLDGSEVEISARILIAELYERRNFAPAWNDPDQVAELISLIEASAADGLNPLDYHLKAIKDAQKHDAGRDAIAAVDRARQDILLTDGLVRLTYHSFFGKVNPKGLDPNWNFRRELNDVDPVAVMQRLIDAESLTESLEALAPRGWVYWRLQAVLADYRALEASGGWPQIPEGPTLKPGEADERLAILQQRLLTTGDLSSVQMPPRQTYDDSLVDGVRRFQERHGLDADGVIGPATLKALNVPVAQRIVQLEVNLERARWVMGNIEDDFILVNIAGFRAYVIRDREVAWKTRVQVGTEYRQSPVFRDEMKYVDINPTWTVPYSIATKDILPKVQRDPAYLDDRNFTVKDRSGAVVDPSDVDWSRLSRSNFPYTLVQRPGASNALGRVKFMFPNQHAVYLHDTPSRALFDRAGRAFSSGCIRVEHPFELAEILLGDQGWTQQRFQEVLDAGTTKSVYLSRPLPVYLLYWTAEVVDDGRVYFYNDVYNRDTAIAKALDEPFRLEPPGR